MSSKKTTVIHTANAAGSRDEVYIGRPSKWGNPFVIGRDGDREEVIAKFEKHCAHLRADADNELRGKVLLCYCSPLACHGDVLARWANEMPF